MKKQLGFLSIIKKNSNSDREKIAFEKYLEGKMGRYPLFLRVCSQKYRIKFYRGCESHKCANWAYLLLFTFTESFLSERSFPMIRGKYDWFRKPRNIKFSSAEFDASSITR